MGGGELTGGGDGGPNREERAGAGARHTPAEDVARCERCGRHPPRTAASRHRDRRNPLMARRRRNPPLKSKAVRPPFGAGREDQQQRARIVVNAAATLTTNI